jgi:protein-S-isoprenylcysteine O-methyltransferase Ste14
VAIVAGATIGQQTTSRLSFFEWGDLISAVVPALFVLLGVFRMQRSRLEAYRTFKTAVLIIIFVTQFFAFYHQQLIAVFGLLVNIVVWVTLRSMIQQEERLVREAAGAALAKPVGHELHPEE